jgi:hypothetical protein
LQIALRFVKHIAAVFDTLGHASTGVMKTLWLFAAVFYLLLFVVYAFSRPGKGINDEHLMDKYHAAAGSQPLFVATALDLQASFEQIASPKHA